MKNFRGKIKALLIGGVLGVAAVATLPAQNPVPVQAKNACPILGTGSPGKLPVSKKSKKGKNSRVESKTRKDAPSPVASFAPPMPIDFPVGVYFGGDTYEKSIAVDPRIKIKLCVSQGDVKVNGWSRNEVRVFVKDGGNVGFDVLQGGRQGGKPVWINVVGTNPKKPMAARDCLWGGVVEIDAPTGASIDIDGKEAGTIVDSIRQLNVKNIGGNISVSNVREGVNATTYEGNVDVESSDGTIVLESGSGNIVVFESGPSEVGDTFKATTHSGAISIQSIEHRQVDVRSISGTILFNSELLSSGVYNVGTENGSIVLGLPKVTPCILSVIYGGRFDPEIPIKIMTENLTPGSVKSITARFVDMVKNECKLNLKSSSGTIRIRKQQP